MIYCKGFLFCFFRLHFFFFLRGFGESIKKQNHFLFLWNVSCHWREKKCKNIEEKEHCFTFIFFYFYFFAWDSGFSQNKMAVECLQIKKNIVLTSLMIFLFCLIDRCFDIISLVVFQCSVKISTTNYATHMNFTHSS